MERRHLRYLSCAGERRFRRPRDRRTFAEVTASKQVCTLKRSEDPVDRVRPQIGLTR